MTSQHSQSRPSSWTRRRAVYALVSITLFALVVRLVGLDFLLPHAWEPDHCVYTTQVEVLRHPEAPPEDTVNHGWYPLLVPRIVQLLPEPATTPAPSTVDEHLERASALRKQIRSVIAALSALIVPATYLLARRFVRRETALVAALLAAASVLNLWFAQQTRPHGVATVTIALAVLGALAVRRRGDVLAYLLAGTLLGLAVSTLQSGLAALPALLAAHVLCTRGRFWVRSAWLASGFALAGLVYFLFRPSGRAALDATPFAPEDGTLSVSGHPLILGLFNGQGFEALWHGFWAYDTVLLLLACGALAVQGIQRLRRGRSVEQAGAPRSILAALRVRGDLSVVLAFVVPYVLIFGVYGFTFPRYALPLVPFVAIYAAVFVVDICGSAKVPGRWRPVLRAAMFVACSLHVACAVRLSILRTRPDTARLAADWITTHADREHDRVALHPGLDLPLLRDAASRADSAAVAWMQNFRWVHYQLGVVPTTSLEPAWKMTNIRVLQTASRELLARDPQSWVRNIDARWIVSTRGLAGGRTVLLDMEAALDRETELAARFAPVALDDADDSPFVYQDDVQTTRPCLWWRIFFATAMGPVVEIRRARGV